MRYKKIVIKVGSNVLTNEHGEIERLVMGNLVDQIAQLKKKGVEIVLVSSGAVASGKPLVKHKKNFSEAIERQVFAAVGQTKIMNMYSGMFDKYGYKCAQVLATKEDFRDRQHYLNMQNCFNALLLDEIVPIVNENDVIAINEIMFSDNDELAGLVAAMLDAEAVIILTNVDGLYDKNPKHEDAELIKNIKPEMYKSFETFVDAEKSSRGRGGMINKCKIGHKLALMGIEAHIVNGLVENNISEIFDGNNPGTRFEPQKKVSNVKKWIAHTKGYEKGIVYITDKAQMACTTKDKVCSILPIGVSKIDGEFEKGDIVQIRNMKNEDIGIGISQYSSKEARELMGKKDQKPLIRYDYLFLEVCTI